MNALRGRFGRGDKGAVSTASSSTDGERESWQYDGGGVMGMYSELGELTFFEGPFGRMGEEVPSDPEPLSSCITSGGTNRRCAAGDRSTENLSPPLPREQSSLNTSITSRAKEVSRGTAGSLGKRSP